MPDACITSRPITLNSEPLTPSHFLIGGPIFLKCEADLIWEEPRTKWVEAIEVRAVSDTNILVSVASTSSNYKTGKMVGQNKKFSFR